MNIYEQSPGMYDPTDPNNIDPLKGLVIVFAMSIAFWWLFIWIFRVIAHLLG